MDIPTLATSLTALSAGNLGLVLAKMRDARDALQTQIVAALDEDPPADATGLSNDFALVNAWIRTLEAAVQPSPPANADTDLLQAMQIADAASANSAAVGGLLASVDGLVKSFAA